MWFLAVRQLLARKKQSLIIIIGIMVGTAAYISFSGIMLGFQAFMTERMINSDGHIHISAKEEDVTADELTIPLFGPEVVVRWRKPPSGRRDHARIDHPAGWFDLLSSDPQILGYAPMLQVQALAQRGIANYTVRVIGIDPSRQIQVTNINENVLNNGSLLQLGRSGNRILLGKNLFSKLGTSLGENISLTSILGTPISFKVIGVFETGAYSIDDTVVYAALADVQKLNRTPSQISDIVLKLADANKAESVADDLALLATDKVQSWQQANQNILSIFNMQDMIRNLISLCILLVAAFGIYNILNVIVTQKRREIGILRSMGFQGREITELFVFQGFIFGVLGGMAGVITGYFVCLYVATLHVGVKGTPGYRNMLVTFDMMIYLKAFLMSLVASIVAGWLPSRAAGKLEPIEIIRSEGG